MGATSCTGNAYPSEHSFAYIFKKFLYVALLYKMDSCNFPVSSFWLLLCFNYKVFTGGLYRNPRNLQWKVRKRSCEDPSLASTGQVCWTPDFQSVYTLYNCHSNDGNCSDSSFTILFKWGQLWPGPMHTCNCCCVVRELSNIEIEKFIILFTESKRWRIVSEMNSTKTFFIVLCNTFAATSLTFRLEDRPRE